MWFPLILLTCLIVVQELYFEKNYSNLLIISVMAWGFSSCLESLSSWHNFKNALHFPLTYLQLFPFPSLPFPSYLFAVFNPSSMNFCYYVRHWLLTFASRIVEYGRGPAMPLSPSKNFAEDVQTCCCWSWAGAWGRQVSEPIWFWRGGKLHFGILPNVLEPLRAFAKLRSWADDSP